MIERPLTSPAQTLREFQDLLRAVATTHPMQRPWAVAYTECRSTLLAGELRSKLPGFVVQCGSIDRFRDFISLYHPRSESRVAFIDSAFRRCWGEFHVDARPSLPPTAH